VQRRKFCQSFTCSFGESGVSNIASTESPKYWAFISYSHKDSAFGRRLHRRLENYALPRRMAGRASGQGVIPRRLAPIFRDREDFSAANDLSTEVRAALQVSRSLIVVCSPAAAASPWVAREVESFRALHPDRPVLAAIREGEPPACFPDALRRIGPAGDSIEPLAADFRKGRDGTELGLLKIVAGILGIGLDELVQRDAQRRTQRETAGTAAALAGMLVMGLLTIFALNARNEADRQRNEAEGLVEFMLTDLRTKLEGVGRLDAMTAVNERAFRYYTDQDLGQLPPDSLERRARILHAMGSDDETRGNYDSALAKFREAQRTTAALLAQAPNDPDRIFNQAQTDFWIGTVDYGHNRFAEAKIAFQAYKELADSLVAINPTNSRYLREDSFAEGDLCSTEIESVGNAATALRLCTAALTHMEMASRRLGRAGNFDADIANRHGWLADAYLANRDLKHALSERLVQDQILHSLMQADPQNMRLKSNWIALQRILAWLNGKSGQREAAIARLKGAILISDQLVAFDPTNKTWTQQRAKLDADINRINSMTNERKQP
jgi:tetratricopeptide (TPR) repeat protein